MDFDFDRKRYYQFWINMGHIVKRKGHNQEFDSRKIYGSVFASCMVLRMSDGEAELLADTVSKEVSNQVAGASQVSSTQIHNWVVESLKKYNPDAAFMYDTHRDIS